MLKQYGGSRHDRQAHEPRRATNKISNWLDRRRKFVAILKSRTKGDT